MGFRPTGDCKVSRRVFADAKDDQIFGSVIKAVPVQVVDDFARTQYTFNLLFGNHSVFVSPSACSRDLDLAVRMLASAGDPRGADWQGAGVIQPTGSLGDTPLTEFGPPILLETVLTLTGIPVCLACVPSMWRYDYSADSTRLNNWAFHGSPPFQYLQGV